MELDLTTCLVAWYVIVADVYQSHITPCMPAGGPPAQMRDSEGSAWVWLHSDAVVCYGKVSALSCGMYANL